MQDDPQPKVKQSEMLVRYIPAITIGVLAVLGLIAFLFGGVVQRIAWFLLFFGFPLIGLFFFTCLLVLAVWKRRFGKAMMVNMCFSLFALLPVVSHLGIIPISYPASIETKAPAASVRLPADVPLRVLQGGDQVGVNYHAAFPDQRWAYDFIVEPNVPGSDKLEDYGCYNVPVVAPAAGLVVQAHDGEPDMKPGRPSLNFWASAGNYVVIKLHTDTHLVIAHLKPNSVSVHAGQEVEEGQVIGLCGNSGNTFLPHIHINHQRHAPAFTFMLDEGLPLFFRDHNGSPMPEGGLQEIDGQIVPVGAVVEHIETALESATQH